MNMNQQNGNIKDYLEEQKNEWRQQQKNHLRAYLEDKDKLHLTEHGFKTEQDIVIKPAKALEIINELETLITYLVIDLRTAEYNMGSIDGVFIPEEYFDPTTNKSTFQEQIDEWL